MNNRFWIGMRRTHRSLGCSAFHAPLRHGDMQKFSPRLDMLPQPQRRLWNELGTTPREFVLYGGTGLALRLGHRQSADFDFFSDEVFTPPKRWLISKMAISSNSIRQLSNGFSMLRARSISRSFRLSSTAKT